MNHDTFADAFESSLRAAGVMAPHERIEQSVQLLSMARAYRGFLGAYYDQPSEPLRGSLELSWVWDAMQTARTTTSEEDAVTVLVGRSSAKGLKTERPTLRIDIVLHGKVDLDGTISVPGPEAWRDWAGEVRDKVSPLLPPSRRARNAVVTGWVGEPEAGMRCEVSGQLALEEVRLAAWQGLELPRAWSASESVVGRDPEPPVDVFAKRLAEALRAWKGALRLLLPRV